MQRDTIAQAAVPLGQGGLKRHLFDGRQRMAGEWRQRGQIRTVCRQHQADTRQCLGVGDAALHGDGRARRLQRGIERERGGLGVGHERRERAAGCREADRLTFQFAGGIGLDRLAGRGGRQVEVVEREARHPRTQVGGAGMQHQRRKFRQRAAFVGDLGGKPDIVQRRNREAGGHETR
jgi:hypothetical protein